MSRLTQDDIRNAIVADLEERILLAKLNFYIVQLHEQTSGATTSGSDANAKLTAQIQGNLNLLTRQLSCVNMDRLQLREKVANSIARKK